MLLKLRGDCLHLCEGVGAMHGQTLCLIGAVVSFDKAVLLWGLWITQPDHNP